VRFELTDHFWSTVFKTVAINRALPHFQKWSGRRGSNSRHLPWQGSALPTELRPHTNIYGIPPGTRTPTNGFGDRRAAITPERYLVPPHGLEPWTPALSRRCSNQLSYGGKNLEHRVGFEPTVFRICNPVHWTSLPPMR
jgi:hypothetical protein